MTNKYRHTLLTALLGMLFFSNPAAAVTIPPEVDAIPVQYQGRVMPFVSFAREHVLAVTGKLHLKGASPSASVLSWMASPGFGSDQTIFDVGYDPFRAEVGLEPKRRKYNLDELLATRRIMLLASQAAQIKEGEGKPTRIQSEAEKLLGKMGNQYALITNQYPAFIPPIGDPIGEWRPFSDSMAVTDSLSASIQFGVAGLLQAYSSGSTSDMAQAASKLTERIRQRWKPDASAQKQFDTEVLYNRLRPIQWGRTLYLIALLMLLGSIAGYSGLLTRLATWAMGLGLGAHLLGLGLRAIIGARAPWSNFYESLVTITAVFVVVGLVYSRGKLKRMAMGGTAMAGYAALLIADNSGLTPGVDTLVPALQSYWLNIHVIIILSGYATATLAMVLGHVALGIEAFKPNDRDLFLTSTKTTYRVIQMSMLLLFAGTILGGVWAHEAWGRYWGWDPKETWALISWFGYVGVAHARFAGWLTPRGLALAAIGVYPLILMTYYGVNYLLSGLHSYAGGESAQVPPLLIGFLVFEAIVVLIGVKGWHTKEGRNSSSKSGQSNSGAEN